MLFSLSGAPVFNLDSQQQRCWQGFAAQKQIFMSASIFFNVLSWSMRAAAACMAKTCWLLCDDLLSSSLSAWLSYQLLAHSAHVHQIALLAFIWPCGCAFRWFIIPLLAMFGHFWAERLSARINLPDGNFIWPFGLAPSWWSSFGLEATPPYRKIDFQQSSQWMFLFFSCSLTAKSNFYSPHGECQFLFFFRLLGAIFHLHLAVVRTSQPWWPLSVTALVPSSLHRGIHHNYQDHWMVLSDEGVLGSDGMPIR